MPSRPKRPCPHPGCTALVTAGYCPAHAPLHTRQARDYRKPANERGYDYTWTRVRNAFLADHPLCWECERRGRVTLATVVHHLQPVETHPHLRLHPGNLRALCRECHEAIEGRRRAG